MAGLRLTKMFVLSILARLQSNQVSVSMRESFDNGDCQEFTLCDVQVRLDGLACELDHLLLAIELVRHRVLEDAPCQLCVLIK